MNKDQAWAAASVLAQTLKRDHFVVALIVRPDDYMALDESQYNALRGRNWLQHYDERVSAPGEAPRRKRASRVELLQRNVAEQRAWIEERGGNEAGYVARYGSANDADKYGDGGEAIYAADLGALRRYEEELKAAGG